jgi:hypothetical protein
MEKRSSARRKTASAGKRAKASRGQTAKRTTAARPKRKWSARVTERSDALDLENRIFTSGTPARIAASLKRSAERSKRRKGTVRQSATSMLNFYINRAGRKLSATRRRVLEQAKIKLRELFEKQKKGSTS